MEQWIVVFALFVVVVLVLGALKKKPSKKKPSRKKPAKKDMPYKLNSSILTKREATFYSVLQPIANRNHVIICIKPRIADFISVTLEQYKKGSEFYTYFNKISAKHVDFLLCDNRFKPLIAFELDDSTHQESSRKDRDAFVDELYNAVGLEICHVYDWRDTSFIEERIKACL